MTRSISASQRKINPEDSNNLRGFPGFLENFMGYSHQNSISSPAPAVPEVEALPQP